MKYRLIKAYMDVGYWLEEVGKDGSIKPIEFIEKEEYGLKLLKAIEDNNKQSYDDYYKNPTVIKEIEV